MQKRRQSRTRRKPRANTADILGASAEKAPRIRPKWQRHYSRLLQLRDSTLQRREGQARDALQEQPTFSTHMADAGTDAYNRDLALGMLSTEQDAVYEIEAALDRIKNGTYGTCELSGKRIEPERLEAIPWTRFCAQAEKELEQRGAVKRARLGERDTVARVTQTEPEEESS